ncbi:MAG: hypothetical protein IKD06_07010 [Clostridia bacterium]|nr:hypothetical protein [Clostridia bacterium]
MIGIYAWTYDSLRGSFWKACGINTVQLAELGWYQKEGEVLDAYLEDVRQQILKAQADGFKVDILLMSNIEQWRGSSAQEPTGFGVWFDPADEEKMRDRLDHIRRTVKAWSMADSFSFIAADPGGITDESWSQGTQAFVKMGKDVREIVREEAPHASFCLNTWAIAYWEYETSDFANLYFKPEYWLEMNRMTQEVIEQIKDTDIGLQFAGQDWYQRTTLKAMSSKYPDWKKMPKYPSAEDLVSFEGRTDRKLIAWPYFFLDLITSNTESNVRYIHRYVQDMRALKVDGIMGDYSDMGYLSHALNAYAFGRFCNDPEATPEQVIAEYASFNATPETSEKLTQVLLFLDNRSTFEIELPGTARIKRFDTPIRSNKQALEALEEIEWINSTETEFPLPESPYSLYIRLRSHFGG